VSRSISVERNLVREILGTPKNHKTRRVDMSQQLTDVFRTLRTATEEACLASGVAVDVIEDLWLSRTAKGTL
jgi:hypothetical protein